MGTCAMCLTFAAISYLPLPEATAIFFVAPILTTVFAALFLGERVKLIRVSAVMTGLIGVLVILWPRLGGFAQGAGEDAAIRAFGAGLALGAACFMAGAKILVRSLSGAITRRPLCCTAAYCALWPHCLTCAVPVGSWPTGA